MYNTFCCTSFFCVLVFRLKTYFVLMLDYCLRFLTKSDTNFRHFAWTILNKMMPRGILGSKRPLFGLNPIHHLGLYYKQVTIVNDDSIIVSEWSFKLIDGPRVVLYDHHMFIIQATVWAKCEWKYVETLGGVDNILQKTPRVYKLV
jgi:hypothetical protein